MPTNEYSSHNYRTWPIFLLSFIRLFSTSIFERALSNYLYRVILISESTLGFISSAGAITYIFAPILGQIITTKFLGVRKALILNSTLTPVLTLFQILFPVPWFLIICRIMNGLAMGLYWPNCLYLLSRWQKVSTMEKSKRDFTLFNFSWNIGFISGLLVGFAWAFFWSEFLAMFISSLISFLLIPISFFIQKEDKSEILEGEIIYQSEDPLSHLDIEEDLVVNSQTPMIIFPILYSWLSIIFLATSKSVFIFVYQFLLKAFESPSYITYLVQCGIQLLQLLGLTWLNYMKVYKRKTVSLFSFVIIILSALSIILIRNIWYISVISTIVGLFLGFIHGVGMKIMLEYGAAKNTARYSTINEILVGIGFGITPIISGYVAEIEVYAIHGFIVVFGIAILIGLIYLSRNVKKSRIQ
ncbi:MAG: MFS transporter [Promethearchaeota archaeon]